MSKVVYVILLLPAQIIKPSSPGPWIPDWQRKLEIGKVTAKKMCGQEARLTEERGMRLGLTSAGLLSTASDLDSPWQANQK